MGKWLYEEAITNKEDSVRIHQSLGNSLPVLPPHQKPTPTSEICWNTPASLQHIPVVRTVSASRRHQPCPTHRGQTYYIQCIHFTADIFKDKVYFEMQTQSSPVLSCDYPESILNSNTGDVAHDLNNSSNRKVQS